MWIVMLQADSPNYNWCGNSGYEWKSMFNEFYSFQPSSHPCFSDESSQLEDWHWPPATPPAEECGKEPLGLSSACGKTEPFGSESHAGGCTLVPSDFTTSTPDFASIKSWTNISKQLSFIFFLDIWKSGYTSCDHPSRKKTWRHVRLSTWRFVRPKVQLPELLCRGGSHEPAHACCAAQGFLGDWKA